MPGYWRNAHIRALPRLKARWQLLIYEAIAPVWSKKEAAKASLQSLGERARRGTEGRRMHDRYGRLIIRSANDLRAWFRSIGMPSQ